MAALGERPFSQTQLFCSNLPWSVNGKILRQEFERHGEVLDAFVAYNGRSSRGFGYVTFKDGKAAAAAVESMNGASLGDDDRSREIRVEMARERPGPRPEPKDRAERPRGDGDAARGRGRGDGRGAGDGRGGDGRGRGGRSDGRGDGRGGGGGRGDDAGSRNRSRGRGRGDEGGKEVGDASVGEEKPAKPAPTVEESSES